MGASQVSAHAEVRAALLDLQRQAGAKGGVVLEGRDIGTVVVSGRRGKNFSDGIREIRAQRRFEELVAKGLVNNHEARSPEGRPGTPDITLASTLEDVRKRDAQDTGREHAPLRQADFATRVDSTNLTIDQTVRLDRHDHKGEIHVRLAALLIASTLFISACGGAGKGSQSPSDKGGDKGSWLSNAHR